MSLMSKTVKSTLIRIVRQNPFNIQANVIAEVINGSVPPELVPYCEPYDGPPYDARIKIDAQQFARDIARARALEESGPLPPSQLTREDVCGRFGWTSELLEQAYEFGFPRSIGRRVSRQGATVTTLYSATAVDRWAKRFSAFVRGTRLEK